MGLKPRLLEHRYQPSMGHGHTRAFDAGDALLAERVHGRVQEALAHRGVAPLRRYHEARQDPQVFNDHVIGVAYRLRATTRRSAARPSEMSQKSHSRHHCPSHCQSPSSSAGTTVRKSTTCGLGSGCSGTTLDTGDPLFCLYPTYIWSRPTPCTSSPCGDALGYVGWWCASGCATS